MQRLRANVAGYFALFGRKPRFTATPAWRTPDRFGVGAVVVVAAIAVTMVAVDARAIQVAQRVPPWLIEIFDQVTDFGKSGWFLVPLALALAAIALLASPALARMTRLVLAAIAVRLGFLFLAIGVPGLVVTIVKRLIGRARPLVEAEPGSLHLSTVQLARRLREPAVRPRHDAFAAAMAHRRCCGRGRGR